MVNYRAFLLPELSVSSTRYLSGSHNFARHMILNINKHETTRDHT